MFDNALQGWARYIDEGKYAALFMAAILGFLYVKMSGGKYGIRVSKQTDTLFWYGTVSGIMAICPFTAAILMMYQTKFYDYEWVWTIVPLTAVIACAFTVLYLGFTRGKWRKKIFESLLLAASVVCVIFLCGNLGGSRNEEDPYRKLTESILESLEKSDTLDGICMWAPSCLLQHVREYSGDVTLVYGRNMWEEELNAYTYDIYEEDVVELYEWMEEMGSDWERRMNLPGNEEIINTAVDNGINCMVIPAEASVSFAALLDEVTFGTEYEITMEEVEGYCVFRLL